MLVIPKVRLPSRLHEIRHNSLRLERFGRRAPLPARPRRALVFSNYASNQSYLPAIEAAAARLGVRVLELTQGRLATVNRA